MATTTTATMATTTATTAFDFCLTSKYCNYSRLGRAPKDKFQVIVGASVLTGWIHLPLPNWQPHSNECKITDN